MISELNNETMAMAARVEKIFEVEADIQRISERVHGMVLMGQDRDDLKSMVVLLARRAKAIATLCGDASHFGHEA